MLALKKKHKVYWLNKCNHQPDLLPVSNSIMYDIEAKWHTGQVTRMYYIKASNMFDTKFMYL